MMSKRDMAGERPTMERVAELAGVSTITVSRALRGSDLVRPELRERITRIAKDIGYRVNLAARSLRTRRSQTIAVVIEQLNRGDRPIADPLLLTMIGGLLEALTPAGYAMLLTTNDQFIAGNATATEGTFVAENALGADGVVVLGEGEQGRQLNAIKALGIPTIAWGEPLPGLNLPVLGSANHTGGKLAADHLIATGRSRLLFLGDGQHPEVAARLAGFREVLAASDARLIGVRSCAFNAEAGGDAVRAALDDGDMFDGIFAASDTIAAGACDALVARGMAVPGDVGVVGFDDAPIAAAHRPSLTTIRQDGAAAGRALGAAVIALIERNAEPLQQLPVELVVRESSAH